MVEGYYFHEYPYYKLSPIFRQGAIQMDRLITVVQYVQPIKLLGKTVKVVLIDGGNFFFRVTESGLDYIIGYDQEQNELKIHLSDLECVVVK